MFKKQNLQGAQTKVGFTIFPWNYAHVLYVVIPKNLRVDFFCFVFLSSTDSEKMRYFVGAAKESMRAKFHWKTINFAELEPLEIFIFQCTK